MRHVLSSWLHLLLILIPVAVALELLKDLALGIAVGSSMQIALFVAPVLVFASYFFGHPLDLIVPPSKWRP